MILLLIISAIVLAYSAMAVDANRKCSGIPAGEKKFLSFTNTVMLIASICGVLYSGWHLFAPSTYQDKLKTYF